MTAKKEYIFEGVPVQVVRRPRMKNIRVKVVPPYGDVVLSCAPGVRNYEWMAVLREAWQGIVAAREKFLQGWGERIAAQGGRCFLWGKAYELKVVFTEHARFARLADGHVVLADGHVVLAVPPGSGREQLEDCLYELYRRELERAVPEVFPRCEQITGLSAKEVRLKRMKTRWGSCNVKEKRVWLSLNLAKMPPECLQYVIIHELVHLLEKNHTLKFHALVAGFYPAWQQAEKWLRGERYDGSDT